MDRRAFIGTVAGGLLAAPLAVEAQPAPKVARLGVLLFSTRPPNPTCLPCLRGLRDLGYVEGRNIVFEYRGAEGRPERVGGLAHQIVALKPDLIVVLGGDLVPFVKGATSTIPIVMLTSQDPVEAGEVASFARPGGNLTGVAFVSSETAGKRLQFLKEASDLTDPRRSALGPRSSRRRVSRHRGGLARRLGIHAQSLEVRRPEEFDGAFEAAMRARPRR